MRGLIKVSILGLALLAGPASFAATPAQPAHIGRYAGTPEDLKAIAKVAEDFQAALISKDIKLLSSLLFNSNILFSSPADDGYIQNMRETTDVNFDGIGSGGYAGFAKFVKQSPERIEEKFYNIKITQDRHVAWVSFDYEFLVDNKLSNYGVEAWQMLKTGGQWKIFSVVWSTHGANQAK